MQEEKPKTGIFGLVVHTTAERRREVYYNVVFNSTPTGSFYVMVAISTTIAAYGLLSNSTAVVIGAMLVAPLMGPIFGVGLSLATGDRDLLRHATRSEIYGVLLAIGLSALIGLVPLRLGFGSEIMARTQPTLYDIIIALASGFAGTYALMDVRISPALPGVAIATALVPPLTACGLCLAAGRWEWALGAFLLFFANFLAIELAAALVFTAFDMLEVQTHHRALTLPHFLRRFGPSMALLVVVSVFMTHTLLAIVAERRFTKAVETTLAREVRSTAGAHLEEFRHETREGALEVIATVLTPREFAPAQVARIETILRREVSPHIHLILRSLLSKDVDRRGAVFIADEEREQRAEVAAQNQFLTRVSQVLNAQFNKIEGARVVDIIREGKDGSTTVTAVVSTPTVIEPDQVGAIEDTLRAAVSMPVQLIVRSILTQDADAQRYLYREEPEPLSGAALRFHQRLEAALKNQLRTVPGARLSEFRYAPRDGRLRLLAVVRTPRSLEPAQVRQIELTLRRYVHPRLDLVMRSVVAADTTATGHLSDFDAASAIPPVP